LPAEKEEKKAKFNCRVESEWVFDELQKKTKKNRRLLDGREHRLVEASLAR